MTNSNNMPVDPSILKRQSSTKTLIAIALVVAIGLTIGAWSVFQFFPSTPNPLIGVWQGIDEYGGQHFYEFHDDGSMLWWDVDRGDFEGPPQKRGPFTGTFHYEKAAIMAQAPGFGGRVGILKHVGRDTLHQEFDGHAMRQNLDYRRVSDLNGPRQLNATPSND